MQTFNLPVFQFFVGHPPVALNINDDQWRAPLPLDRKGAGDNGPSYGDYFTAVSDFLGQDRLALPCRIAGLDPAQPASAAAIHGIQIHLVKHGAFYHPARITLCLGARTIDFVVNVAVSEAGRRRLAAEVDCLQSLHRIYPDSSVPAIYGRGAGHCAASGPLPMFAGQWLGGFHELHLRRDPSSPHLQWSVWDSDNGAWTLDPEQAASFFRQAVFILARYFDPHTLSAIMEWHHAAGDFIVRKNEADIDVRLITVRRYGPLFKMNNGELNVETLMEALTVFWMKTSFWMRLDRLDGVGELVWADGDVVAPMWQGFVQGLAQMAGANGFPAEFVPVFQAHLAGYAPADFIELGADIAGTFPEDMPETGLIRSHLPRHAEQVAAAVRALQQP